MPKMSDAELRAMLAAEKADALSAISASKLSEERAAAIDYYLGDMSRDMPAPDGRSKAVSTDVADTIEGLMPSLMDIFTSGDEVVRFEPVGPEDVAAAEQETDYVNHVFMQQNPGFLVLYSFIKDALLSKVGIVKVWWETREEHERETYYDLDDAAFAIIAADPDVEIVAHTERRPANGEIASGEDSPSRFATRCSAFAAPRRHRADHPHPPMRARGRRAAGGIRHRAACALDPRRGLLLSRRAQVGSQADRAGLRPRADQAPAVLRVDGYDRGAGPRHRRRRRAEAGRRRAQRRQPPDPGHRALCAHGLRGQRHIERRRA